MTERDEEAVRRLIDGMRADALSREECDRIALSLGPLLGPPEGGSGGEGSTGSAEPISDGGNGGPLSGGDLPLGAGGAEAFARAAGDASAIVGGVGASVATTKGTAVLGGATAWWKMAAAVVVGTTAAVGVPALVEGPPADEVAVVAPPPTVEAPYDPRPRELEAEATNETLPPGGDSEAPSSPPDRPARSIRPAERGLVESPGPATKRPHPSPPLESPVVHEHQLLAEARAVLGVDAARALELADSHRERFPRGLLSPEREIIAIDALASLGRTEDARRRAARFAAQHRASYHVQRLRERGLVD